MKNKKWLIPVVIIFVIVTLWLSGIIPKQIAKISGTNYVNEHFPEMQMKCIGVEYADVFGDYLITFKDKGENTYSCVIGPYLFPCSLGQGLFEIQEYYTENFRLNSNTSNGYDTALNNDEKPNKWGIILEVENVSANGLTIVCNHSGGENVAELNTGSYYVIQKLEKTGWVDVEYLSLEYELVWTSEAWTIQKESTTQWEVNWEWLYGKLSTGEYRIGKEIMNFRDTGDYDTEMVYAGFIIN